MRTVIAFDISSGRVRYRVVKALVEFAQRVQKSVFEAPELDRAAYLRLRSRLEGLIDSDTDAIRYYQLCESCAKRIEEHGCGPGTIPMTLPFEIL